MQNSKHAPTNISDERSCWRGHGRAWIQSGRAGAGSNGQAERRHPRGRRGRGSGTGAGRAGEARPHRHHDAGPQQHAEVPLGPEPEPGEDARGAGYPEVLRRQLRRHEHRVPAFAPGAGHDRSRSRVPQGDESEGRCGGSAREPDQSRDRPDHAAVHAGAARGLARARQEVGRRGDDSGRDASLDQSDGTQRREQGRRDCRVEGVPGLRPTERHQDLGRVPSVQQHVVRSARGLPEPGTRHLGPDAGVRGSRWRLHERRSWTDRPLPQPAGSPRRHQRHDEDQRRQHPREDDAALGSRHGGEIHRVARLQGLVHDRSRFRSGGSHGLQHRAREPGVGWVP